MWIQTPTFILDPLAEKDSEFGALRSENTVNRCFARDANDRSGPSYPMPIAISLDAAPRLGKLNSLALKLKHTLLFLSWNLLRIYPGEEFELSSCELTNIIGADHPPRTAQLRTAFHDLCSVNLEVRTYFDLAVVVQRPILQSYAYRSGRFKWQFSEVVEDWSTEPASFAWIDLDVVRQLRSRFALGFYEIGAALVGRNEGHVFLSHDELRLCLGIDSQSYTQPSDLKKRVITAGLKEVNNIAPFSISMSPASRCRDRRVDGYEVVVRREPTEPTDFRVAPLARNEWQLVDDEAA
jgi:Initiator Rep protein, WH2